MTDLAEWPDIEIVVRSVLLDLATVGTEVPADPDGSLSWLPFLRVTCYGGSDDTHTDTSRIDVDAFAATKGAAAALAGAARQRLLNGPHVMPDRGVLDSVKTDVKPHQVPYSATPPPYEYTAAYSGQMRRL